MIFWSRDTAHDVRVGVEVGELLASADSLVT